MTTIDNFPWDKTWEQLNDEEKVVFMQEYNIEFLNDFNRDYVENLYLSRSTRETDFDY